MENVTLGKDYFVLCVPQLRLHSDLAQSLAEIGTKIIENWCDRECGRTEEAYSAIKQLTGVGPHTCTGCYFPFPESVLFVMTHEDGNTYLASIHESVILGLEEMYLQE